MLLSVDRWVLANRTADLFEVPKTTLNNRLSGRVEHGSESSPASYLNKRSSGNKTQITVVVSLAPKLSLLDVCFSNL